MIIILYLISCLVLLIVQSTLLPDVQAWTRTYDLLIPLVVHAGLLRPWRESLPLICLMGFLTDSISGGPSGFYLTLYIWLFIGTRYLRMYLHVNNIFLVTLVVLAAVALENLARFGLIAMSQAMEGLAPTAFEAAISEVLWALVTAPLLLSGLNALLRRASLLKSVLFAKTNGFTEN
jgi:cell shape-determining protein MreD